MRSLRFIDLPRPAAPADYAEATNLLVRRMATFPGLIGIIRFGHLTTPGISDIDLLAVFEDDAVCTADPLEDFPGRLRHLLSHNMDAMSYGFFRRTADFTFWFNSECIWGDRDRLRPVVSRTPDEERILKRQTAVEYLVTNTIDLTLQDTYGMVKLRSMLQHVKGLRYDLDFLDIRSGTVYERVTELREWIVRWHREAPSFAALRKWIPAFRRELTALTGDLLHRQPLYVPQRTAYRYARHITMRPAQRFGIRRRGLLLPAPPARAGRKYYNLQHRLNRWTVGVPFRHDAEDILMRRFAYFRDMKRHNTEHFPRFGHLTTGFSVHFD